MDNRLVEETPEARKPVAEDRTVIVSGIERSLSQTVADRMTALGWRTMLRHEQISSEDLAGADALVCCNVIENEPSWLTCSAEEWHSMRKQGLDDLFELIQGYANARAEREAPGAAVIISGCRTPEAEGQNVLGSCISWGVRGLVRNAAATYAHNGIRINGILADTASADADASIAALAIFLIEQGDHITGQVIPVADGKTLL
jgi:NAD(P)-dependent dehydrogenase (short-subunit alcohol dehydrogenase family)